MSRSSSEVKLKFQTSSSKVQPKRSSSKVQKVKFQSHGQGQVPKSWSWSSSNSKVQVKVQVKSGTWLVHTKFNIDQSAMSSLFHIQPSYDHKKSLMFYYRRCNPLLIKAIKLFITDFSEVVKFMQISNFISFKFLLLTVVNNFYPIRKRQSDAIF